MFGSAIVVFREVLEAALIIAIVMGAARGVAHRGRWVAGGIGLGVLGAIIVAIFAGVISESIAGTGQEVFNAGVLLAAVLMLAWHNIWMSSHGRQLAGEMKRLGHDVSVGVKPLSAIMLVTAMAVLREGSEIVLFLYGMFVSGTGQAALLAGGAAGLAAGALLGVLLYRGLLRIPLKYFFTVTGWVVTLLAAGLALNAAGFLTQAGYLPELISEVWDTSSILPQDSALGSFLRILIGYTDRPTGVQMLAYIITLAAIVVLTRWVADKRPSQKRS